MHPPLRSAGSAVPSLLLTLSIVVPSPALSWHVAIVPHLLLLPRCWLAVAPCSPLSFVRGYKMGSGRPSAGCTGTGIARGHGSDAASACVTQSAVDRWTALTWGIRRGAWRPAPRGISMVEDPPWAFIGNGIAGEVTQRLDRSPHARRPCTVRWRRFRVRPIYRQMAPRHFRLVTFSRPRSGVGLPCRPEDSSGQLDRAASVIIMALAEAPEDRGSDVAGRADDVFTRRRF